MANKTTESTILRYTCGLVLLVVLSLFIARCSAWVAIPAEDRAAILQQTIASGIDAIARRPHVEVAPGGCITSPPTLWSRAPFTPTYHQPAATQGLIASGVTPPSGPGMLRIGTSGCYEILTLVSGDPGNMWVPFIGTPSQLTQANFYNRYGWGYWAGHSHGVDGAVCSPVQWYLELEGLHLTCGDQLVIDTWFNKPGFYALWNRYKALHPEPAVTPTPTPPTPVPNPSPVVVPTPTPTPPTPSCPPATDCPPEKVCPAPVVCITCPTPPTLTLVPSDVLATASHMAEWVPIRKGKNAKADQAKVAALHRLQDWIQAQRACEAVTLSPVVIGDPR